MTRRLLALVATVLLLTGAAAERADPAPERCAYPKVARTLNTYLARKHSPAAGQGCLIATEAIRGDLHPAFVVAVAGTESSYWTQPCRNNPRNGWGLASCTGIWHVPYFHTWRQAIRFFVSFVNARFPGATTPYSFRGYAANSDAWGAATTRHMRAMGYGNGVRWPW